MKGKGVFAWDLMGINRALGGGYQNVPPAVLGNLLREGGIRRIEIKVANGTYRDPSVTCAFVDALRASWDGEIYGWSFMVAGNPGTQGALLAKIVEALGLDGGIGDLESAFERQVGAVAAARKFVLWYHGFTLKPLGLCSWAKHWSSLKAGAAVWHDPKVAKAFMEQADFAMPMAYWPGTGVYVSQFLVDSLEMWGRITNKPIIPAGRAYTGDGGTVTEKAMHDFEATVRIEGCPGISWWSLKHALRLKWPWEVVSSMESW